MMRKSCFLAIIISVFLLLQIADAAELNVSSNSVKLSNYTNTNSNITMLNLTLSYGSNESIRIGGIIVTFNSTNESLSANATNLSVCVYNSFINLSQRLGCNATWGINNNPNKTSVSISNLTLTNESKNILIVYEVGRNVPTPINISLFVLNDSIITNSTNLTIRFLNGINYNDSTKIFSSNFTQIQDLHAVAKLLPRYADTSVKNQEIVYILNSTGRDKITSFIIGVPENFSIGSANVKYSITKIDNTTATYTSCTDLCKIENNNINITSEAGISFANVNITINTTKEEGNFTFNSKIYGENLSDVDTDVNTTETTLFIKQLFNISRIGVMKNAAIVNGSDYWLFNFTITANENVSGFIQFKMNSWRSDSKNAIIPLTNSSDGNTTYYASMWLHGNESNICYITEEYNITSGVRLDMTKNTNYTLILKMIIPQGTPIARDWWTTYSMLFRTFP